MDEISLSNIMQRDNKKFARKLDKSLAKLAKEKNKTVSNEKGDLESFKHGSVWVYIEVIFGSIEFFAPISKWVQTLSLLPPKT